MYKMYKITKNNETEKLEIKEINFNLHPSIIGEGCDKFMGVYAREFAKSEWLGLRSRYLNELGSADDVEKMNLLESEFSFSTSDTHTDVSNAPVELQKLIYLTLFADNAIVVKFGIEIDPETGLTKKNKDGREKWGIDRRVTLGLNTFYGQCKTIVAQVENGALTLEQAVDKIKPLYNEASNLINHEAEKGVCKKWVESTKEKNTRAFVTGLLSTYKKTRSNMIDRKSPLFNLGSFERYVAMWLVTGGQMKRVKQSGDDAIALDSLVTNSAKKSGAMKKEEGGK